jgi:MFS family permease
VLHVGLLVFGAASFAGGLGNSPGELTAARAMMGIGTALIFPATLSLLTNVFTERGERARATGLWGASAGVGIAVGPIVGGWLLERDGWESVFFALVPIAALAMLLVSAYVPTSRDPEAPAADRPGLLCSTAAMAALIYTIIEAPNRGWTAGLSIGGFAAAGVLFVAFVVWERRVPIPMLDRALFRNLRFSAASGAVTITFFSLMGFIFVVTLYFQFLKGYAADTAPMIDSVAGTLVRPIPEPMKTICARRSSGSWCRSMRSRPRRARWPAKAGVRSAVNDATRILGGPSGWP